MADPQLLTGSDTPVPINSVAAGDALTPDVAGAKKNTGPTPVLSPSNILGSPSSSLAGIGMLAMGASQYFQQNGTPNTTMGWITFSAIMLSGVASLFAKSGSTIR